MTLEQCDIKKEVEVISINNLDAKLKIRLYEIGFFPASKIQVLNKSYSKKTLLVQVLDSCFTLKSDVAKFIEVKYA